MRASRNLSIRAVREAQRQEYRERRQQASSRIEALLVKDHDTLFGWSDKTVGSDNLKTGRKTV